MLLWILNILAVSETAIATTGYMTNWYGQVSDRCVYIGTHDGRFHCVDLIDGDILWSIDTGGPVHTSTEVGATTYVPSIDGYLFAFVKNYGYKRVPMPIRDLVFFAPFRTESGEIFASAKSTEMYVLNREGELQYTLQATSSIPAQSGLQTDKITLIRINYIMHVTEEGEGGCKMIKVSEFDVNCDSDSNITHEIMITTSFTGAVMIYMNGEVISQCKVPGIPVTVVSSHGKFNFEMTKDGQVLEKHDVLFTALGDCNIAIPSRPLKTPSRIDTLLHGLPALEGVQGPGKKLDYSNGLHRVGRPYFLIESFSAKDPTRPADISDYFESAMITEFVVFPYGMTAASIFVIFSVLHLLQKFFDLLEDAVNAARRIQVDPNDETIGMINNTRCTLVHIPYTETKEELLNYFTTNSISGLAQVRLLEKDDKKGTLTVAYHQLTAMDFSIMNPIELLKLCLETLNRLFSEKFTHGSIDESAFYTDPRGKPVIGNFEKTVSRGENIFDRAKDMKDLGTVILSHMNDVDEPLLRDLLADMVIDNPEERITAEEALQHPLFWSNQKRIELLCKTNDFFSAKTAAKRELFDKDAESLIGLNWQKYLLADLVKEATSHAFYDGTLPSQLLRFIRNKWNHKPNSNDPEVQKISNSADEYFAYFHSLFPNFFVYTYYFHERYCM